MIKPEKISTNFGIDDASFDKDISSFNRKEHLKRKLRKHRKYINITERNKRNISSNTKEAIKPKHFKTISPKNKSKPQRMQTDLEKYNCKPRITNKESTKSAQVFDDKNTKTGSILTIKKSKTPNKNSVYIRNHKFYENNDKQFNNWELNGHQNHSLQISSNSNREKFNETTINQKNRNIENIEHPSLQKYDNIMVKKRMLFKRQKMKTININPLIPRLSMLQRMNTSKVETFRSRRLQESSTKTPQDSESRKSCLQHDECRESKLEAISHINKRKNGTVKSKAI